MIVPKRLVERVKHFLGLNQYETQLWLALLTHGIATAGELAEAAGVPRSRSYDVLESLAKKGLAVIKAEGRPIKYVAVPPEQALENLKPYYGVVAEDRKVNLENMKSSPIVKNLADVYKKGEMVMELPELVGLVRERKNLFTHFATLLGRAKSAVRIMATPQDLRELNMFYLDMIRNAKARGVKVQILAPKGADVGELKKYADVKEFSAPMPRGIVIDGSEAMMMFMNPGEVHKSFDAGVWVNSGYVAQTMNRFFEDAWNE